MPSPVGGRPLPSFDGLYIPVAVEASPPFPNGDTRAALSHLGGDREPDSTLPALLRLPPRAAPLRIDTSSPRSSRRLWCLGRGGGSESCLRPRSRRSIVVLVLKSEAPIREALLRFVPKPVLESAPTRLLPASLRRETSVAPARDRYTDLTEPRELSADRSAASGPYN